MTLPRLNPVLVNLGAVRASSTPGVGWGWFLTLVHIFHPFLCFEEKTVVGIRENLEHHYGKIQTATAQRANQRKAGLVNIYMYPIDWLSSFLQELIH